jgi:hypothetical protein
VQRGMLLCESMVSLVLEYLWHYMMCGSVLQPTYSEEQKWSMNFAKNFDDDSSDSGEDTRSRQTMMVR